jgi:hypothetical protein
MIRSAVLSAALVLGPVLGLATAANAGVTPAPVGNAASPIVKVAEGCGPGFWRGPGGRCHPFAVNRACPPGYHLGPEGKRCWPN